MLDVAGYRITEQIRSTREVDVFAAVRLQDERAVLLKRYAGDPGGESGLASHEADVIRSVSHPGVVRAVELLSSTAGPVLVIERPDGTPFDQLDLPLPLQVAVEVGLALASALEALHAAGWAHTSLEPADVVVLPDRGVRILHFDCARRIGELRHPRPVRSDSGLAYLAPEATGRIRGAPQRASDLFALGSFLHALLTGDPPFVCSDPLEQLHAQLGQQPSLDALADLGLPVGLAGLVARLLEKRPDRRPATCAEVCEELRCHLESADALDDAAGRQAPRIVEPAGAIGYEAELETLAAAWHRVCRGGMETMLVSGARELERSTLADALALRVTREGARLLRGGCGSGPAERPFTGWVGALDSLVDQLRAEGERRFGQRRVELEQTLGDGASLITRIAPRVGELFAGAIPLAVTLDEPPARAMRATAHLLRELVRREPGLVVWLDDVHEADRASLELAALLGEEPPEGLLLVLTCASPTPTDGVAELLETLRKRRVPVEELVIRPLPPERAAPWVAASLGMDPSDLSRLGPLIEHLEGHPDELLERLRDASRREVLAWDLAGWRCTGGDGLPGDSAAARLRARIEALPEAERRLLAHAALLPGPVDRSEIQILADRSGADLDALLERLLAEDLLRAVRAGLEPSTSAVRAAACAIDPEAAPQLHLRLVERESDPSRPLDRTGISRLAEHARGARDLLRDAPAGTRIAAARACVEEARRAIGATATESAVAHLETASHLLSEADRATQDELACELALLEAYTAARAGDTERADRSLRRLESRGTDPLGQTRATLLRMRELGPSAPGAELELAWSAARRIGLRPPGRISRAAGQRTLRRARRLVLARSEAFLAAPREGAVDPVARARSELLAAIEELTRSGPSALHAHVVATSVLALREHADAADAQARLGECAQIFCSELGDYEAARAAASLAQRAGERVPLARSARVRWVVQGRIQPWFAHPRTFLDDLEMLGRRCSQLQEPAIAAETWLSRTELLLAAGEPLGRLVRELERIAEYASRAGLGRASERAMARSQALQRLIEADPAGSELHPGPAGPGPDRGVFRATADYLLGDFHAVLERPDEPDRVTRNVADRSFLEGMAAATLCSSGLRERRQRHSLRNALRRARQFCELGPENFEHQLLALEAEQLRNAGALRDATFAYTRALERADALGYVSHAAMICERQTSLWLELNLAGEASRALRGAISRFEAWGAAAKVARLYANHAELLPAGRSERAPEPSRSDSATTTTTTLSSTRSLSATSSSTVRTTQTLDLTTVLRSSEAISGEVQLDRVLERVMSIAIENAGAERSVLLLEQDGELYLNAEGSVAGTTLHLREPLPLSLAEDQVPHNLIQYVQRTRRIVVLGNASSEGLFADDPYVHRTRAKSILCLPVLRQAKLVGVLYLENALVSNAFTEERVEVLNLLSSQAAISLDNSRLYYELTTLNRDLERRVEQRTEELREARDTAEAATRAKSEFLAVMSHEIRTPMNVVIGMAQLLAETELSDDQRGCVQAVRTAGDSLLAIINDILDFSKIEAGKLELETISFSLRDCIEDVAEILAVRARDKGLEFPVFVARSLPDELRGDPARLKQIVINFVNNAIKFTEAGEVEVRVLPGEPAADTAPGHCRIRCEVRDTGIGIPANRLDRLFQSFSQVDASTTRRYGGTGLGLAISKRLAEAMGGCVGVASEEGVGSTFWFEVALGREVQAAETRPLGSSGPTSWVLIPHRPTAEALCEQIATLGATATVFDSPERALAGADEREPERPVFVRFPLEFPDGAAALATLRERGCRVFLIASLHDHAEAERTLGGAALLSAPIKRRALQAALAQAYGIEDRHAPDARREVAEDTKNARARFQILVAEDYVLNQKLAVRLLARGGYTCDVVGDGQKVLEATASGTYDLVLMDCQMPVMDGFEATRLIRERETETGGHLPIIAMTANAMKGDRERCIEAGMDDYLSKPIRVDALLALLEKYLPDA